MTEHPEPERVAFEAWKRLQGGHYMSRNNAPGSDLSGYQDAHTQGQWEAWKSAIASERERCAKKANDFLTKGRSPLGRQVSEAILNDE